MSQLTVEPPKTQQRGSQPPPPSSGHGPGEAAALLDHAAAVLASVDPTSVSPEVLGRLLVRVQAQVDSIAGTAAKWTKAFADAGGFELDGSPTMQAWARQHLRVTGYESRRRARAALALDRLPGLRAAVLAGEVNTAHVDVLALGVHRLGVEVIAEFEEILLDVARACDADQLKVAVKKIEDTLDADAQQRAYLRALEKRDITVAKVGDGYALSGFLDPETGAALQQVLYSMAKPESKDDLRPAAHRRVDALGELCRAALDHGLPTDRGLRPHLFVTVTADRLESVLQTPAGKTPSHGSGDAAEPASLNGFGEIPDSVLSKLACDCALTPIVTDHPGPFPSVLDVGRTQRLATLRQRQAIFVQQTGVCFAPGCDRTHLEIHHMVPWSLGGETNLKDLRGYCTRCHHLIHQGLLVVKPDGNGGWSHRTTFGHQLTDRYRRSHVATSVFAADVLAGGIAHARERRRRWRRGDPGPQLPAGRGRPRPDAPIRT